MPIRPPSSVAIAQLEALAAHAQHTIGQDTAILKDRLAGRRTADAHLVLCLTNREAQVGAPHDEGGHNSGTAALIQHVIGNGDDDEHISQSRRW